MRTSPLCLDRCGQDAVCTFRLFEAGLQMDAASSVRHAIQTFRYAYWRWPRRLCLSSETYNVLSKSSREHILVWRVEEAGSRSSFMDVELEMDDAIPLGWCVLSD